MDANKTDSSSNNGHDVPAITSPSPTNATDRVEEEDPNLKTPPMKATPEESPSLSNRKTKHAVFRGLF